MINLDDELAEDYLAECREHLADIETDLLAIEKGGAEIDEELVNRVFRAVHSVKGGAGFFDLVKIRELAHQTEDVLALIRSRQLVPTPDRVRVLLSATDKLRELIQNPGTSNQADIAEIMAALAGLPADHRASADTAALPPAASHARAAGTCGCFWWKTTSPAACCCRPSFPATANVTSPSTAGKPWTRFAAALERGQPYDLICMDIMMPEMDGREAVRQVRAMEEAHGILSTFGAKIIMTTTVDDIKEVIRCFQELCDAYLMKPIDLSKLLYHMKSYRLVQ